MLVAAVGAAGCGGSRPAVPAPAPAVPARAAAVPAARPHAPADARFMQHMIVHHAQALAMTSLVADRAGSERIRLMAERIDVSQRDEMARMRAWLTARSEPQAAADGAHAHHGASPAMPGMLTPPELERLAAARGDAFDRLFLEFMIRHHEGALTMVAELLATDGAGRELEIYSFASEVDADQRAEIRRMRTLLDAMSSGSPPRG